MPFRPEPLDIVIILLVAVLLFGPSRLPDIGRGLGKALSEFRRGSKDMIESFREGISGEEPSAPPQPPPTFPQPKLDADLRMDTRQPASGKACAQCGAANPPDARFCNQCGDPVPA